MHAGVTESSEHERCMPFRSGPPLRKEEGPRAKNVWKLCLAAALVPPSSHVRGFLHPIIFSLKKNNNNNNKNHHVTLLLLAKSLERIGRRRFQSCLIMVLGPVLTDDLHFLRCSRDKVVFLNLFFMSVFFSKGLQLILRNIK